MKDENFFTVKGWMVNRLKLKGNDLMVYAIIYGFSQNGEFHKISTRYMSEAIGGVDAKTVRAAIESLEKKGLIQKDQEDVAGVTVNSFRVAQDMVGEKFPGVREKFPMGGGKNFPGVGEKFPRGVGKNSPPIYIYNNNNKTEGEYARAREDGEGHTPPGFPQVAPAPVPNLGYPQTPQEVMDKATIAGIQGATIEEAEAFLDYYSSRGWLAAAGVRIVNWQASFKSWLRKSKEKQAIGAKNGDFRGSNAGVRQPYIEGRFNVAGDGYEYSDLDRIFGKESDSAGTGEAGNAGAGARP